MPLQKDCNPQVEYLWSLGSKLPWNAVIECVVSKTTTGSKDGFSHFLIDILSLDTTETNHHYSKGTLFDRVHLQLPNGSFFSLKVLHWRSKRDACPFNCTHYLKFQINTSPGAEMNDNYN